MNPVNYAYSLLGQPRISVIDVESKVRNVGLVRSILERHGYIPVYKSHLLRGWAIHPDHLLSGEYFYVATFRVYD